MLLLITGVIIQVFIALQHKMTPIYLQLLIGVLINTTTTRTCSGAETSEGNKIDVWRYVEFKGLTTTTTAALNVTRL